MPRQRPVIAAKEFAISSGHGLATRAGFLTAGLGPRTLRTETAGPCAVGVLQFLFGDLGGKGSPPEDSENGRELARRIHKETGIQIDIIGGEELELYLAELRTEKPYQIKKVAKYIDKAKTKIDFVKEAIAVRKDRNYYAKNIGDYTDKQLSEISKNKHILVRTSYFN